MRVWLFPGLLRGGRPRASLGLLRRLRRSRRRSRPPGWRAPMTSGLSCSSIKPRSFNGPFGAAPRRKIASFTPSAGTDSPTSTMAWSSGSGLSWSNRARLSPTGCLRRIRSNSSRARLMHPLPISPRLRHGCRDRINAQVFLTITNPGPICTFTAILAPVAFTPPTKVAVLRLAGSEPYPRVFIPAIESALLASRKTGLHGSSARVAPRVGWAICASASAQRWCSRRGSNPDHRLRRPIHYPLCYRNTERASPNGRRRQIGWRSGWGCRAVCAQVLRTRLRAGNRVGWSRTGFRRRAARCWALPGGR